MLVGSGSNICVGFLDGTKALDSSVMRLQFTDFWPDLFACL